MGVITIIDLQRAANKYEPTLQTLPFEVMGPELAKLGINLVDVSNKDTLVQFQRKAGLARPYVAGTINEATEIGKAVERTLQVLPCVAVLKDHIMNYREKLVATNDPMGQKVNNPTKEHPAQQLILETMVKTVSEDVLLNVFHSTRDVADQTPSGLCDGFNTIIDNEVVAGDIATGKGNLVTTGALAAPISETDTEAFDKLVAFIRSAHPQLRMRGRLLMSDTALFYAIDALANKLKQKGALAYDIFLEYLRGMTSAPNLQIVTSSALGTGSRLIYIAPAMLDLGMNTKTDITFVQVRDAYEDPNYVQFWNQFELGCRIRSTHAKEFQVNDETNTALDLAGDYNS